MAPIKRTTIRVETKSLSVIRLTEASTNLWCPRCTRIVPMVAPEYAAQICRVTPREIYRGIESGELHFTETEGEGLLVCCSSLRGEVNERPFTKLSEG